MALTDQTPGVPGAPPTAQGSRLFYGWVVVGVSFLTQFMVTGFIFYSFAVVLIPLAEEFSDGRRAPITYLHLALGLVGVVLSPILGRLVGKNWIRVLMTTGALALGLGMIAASHARELWQIGLIYGVLFSFAGGTLSGLTATAIVVNWFERRRAMALAASQLGASLGGAVMAPVMAALIGAHGWRGAYQILGSVALCSVPVIWALASGRPEDRRAQPDGDAPKHAGEQAATPTSGGATSFRTGDALRQPNLWLISMATGLAFMSTGGLLNHVVAYGEDSGFSAARAATLASLLATGAALGKLVFGWLADRIGEPRAFVLALIGQGIGMIAMVFVPGYATTAAVVLLTGIALGGNLPLSSALLARAFGRDLFGPMMGLMMPIMIPVQLLGPILPGWVRDSLGSYDLAFWFFAAVTALAILLVRLVRLPPPTPAARSTSPDRTGDSGSVSVGAAGAGYGAG